MSPPDQRPASAALRRAGVAAGTMVGTAVGAHVGAGGVLPPPSVLVFLTSVLALVGVLVAGGRASRWGSLGLVGASQYVVHEVLVATSGWSVGAVASVGACGPGHGHGPAPGCGPAVPASGTSWATALDLRMLAFHAVATVATGLLLVVGDRVAATAVTALAPVLRRRPVLRRPVLVPTARWTAPPPPPVPAPSVVCVRRRPRRGPPCGRGVAPMVLA